MTAPVQVRHAAHARPRLGRADRLFKPLLERGARREVWLPVRGTCADQQALCGGDVRGRPDRDGEPGIALAEDWPERCGAASSGRETPRDDAAPVWRLVAARAPDERVARAIAAVAFI